MSDTATATTGNGNGKQQRRVIADSFYDPPISQRVGPLSILLHDLSMAREQWFGRSDGGHAALQVRRLDQIMAELAKSGQRAPAWGPYATIAQIMSEEQHGVQRRYCMSLGVDEFATNFHQVLRRLTQLLQGQPDAPALEPTPLPGSVAHTEAMARAAHAQRTASTIARQQQYEDIAQTRGNRDQRRAAVLAGIGVADGIG